MGSDLRLKMTMFILFFYSLCFLTTGARILEDQNCQLPMICIWQTCNVGCESHWVTVICDIWDDYCDETFDINSGRCSGCSNLECDAFCKPCFDLDCSGCLDVWEDCDSPLFGPYGVGICPEDPFLGANC